MKTDLNKNVPDKTIIKCLIRDNKCLIKEIKELEVKLNEKDKLINEFKAKVTQLQQAHANYKKQTKTFYDVISKEEGFKEIIKELKESRKKELISLRKQRDDLMFITGKYIKMLQENCLL